MAIPVILKGDTSSPIAVTVPEAASTLTLRYQGVTRTYTGVEAGAAVTLQFTAEETAAFRLGTFPVFIHAETASGTIKTYPITAKVKVTDCPGEVYNAGITTVGGTPVNQTSVSEVAEGSTMKEIRDTVNKLARIISGTASVFAACVALGAANLEDISGTNKVYTAKETDEAINAAVTAAGSVTPGAVSNIVSAMGNEFGKVKSVNGETGDVSITAASIGALPMDDTGHIHVSDGIVVVNTRIDLDANSTLVGLGGYYDFSNLKSDGKPVAHEYQVEDVKTSVSNLNNTVDAWQTYWDGDDVRLTVTNYYGTQDYPHLYLEQKVSDGGTNYFKTIWDELTRLTPLNTSITNLEAEIGEKADKAWGAYDSETGALSPDGWTQISSENILLASGMAYQKTVTTGGNALWVLTATDPTSLSGVTSNGFFRITDGDGNALFEIVKGDKRTVGASATAVAMNGADLVITYNVTSENPPVLQLCGDLKAQEWKSESETTLATVAWTETSGAWVATVTPSGLQKAMFAKATYEVGGNTYIKNTVAHSADKVVIGGVEYTVKVETIDGRKLMVLE